MARGVGFRQHQEGVGLVGDEIQQDAGHRVPPGLAHFAAAEARGGQHRHRQQQRIEHQVAQRRDAHRQAGVGQALGIGAVGHHARRRQQHQRQQLAPQRRLQPGAALEDQQADDHQRARGQVADVGVVRVRRFLAPGQQRIGREHGGTNAPGQHAGADGRPHLAQRATRRECRHGVEANAGRTQAGQGLQGVGVIKPEGLGRSQHREYQQHQGGDHPEGSDGTGGGRHRSGSCGSAVGTTDTPCAGLQFRCPATFSSMPRNSSAAFRSPSITAACWRHLATNSIGY